jgi:hypothetical protein
MFRFAAVPRDFHSTSLRIPLLKLVQFPEALCLVTENRLKVESERFEGFNFLLFTVFQAHACLELLLVSSIN